MPAAATTSMTTALERMCEIARSEPLPTVLVDLDAFDRNVQRVAAVVAGSGVTVRIASKSLRVPALLRRVLDAGPPFSGVMCYSAREAEQLHADGFEDLYVAYPTSNDADLSALRRTSDAGATVRVAVDSLAAAWALSAAFAGSATPARVVLDVDASLRLLGGIVHVGVRRSPLHTPADVASFARDLGDVPNIRVTGLMSYEAQIAGLPDANPFRRSRNLAARYVRRVSIKALLRQRAQVRDALAADGIEVELFNGGGTGSLSLAAADDSLTEVTAGSALLCSHLFDYYRSARFEPAAYVALQVARAPASGLVTVQGGGYVASGEAGRDRLPVPSWPAGAKLLAAEGAGEVQTPLKLPAGARLGPGDVVLMRHAKAGELAERFGEYLLVAGGELRGRTPTYRGLGWCFG